MGRLELLDVPFETTFALDSGVPHAPAEHFEAFGVWQAIRGDKGFLEQDALLKDCIEDFPLGLDGLSPLIIRGLSRLRPFRFLLFGLEHYVQCLIKLGIALTVSIL